MYMLELLEGSLREKLAVDFTMSQPRIVRVHSLHLL